MNRTGSGALLLHAGLAVGCTFYSNCPDYDANPSPSGAGGTGGTGGTGQWVTVTSNLNGLETECGSSTYLASKYDEDMLIVGVASQGLWASRNGGESWERLGTGDSSSSLNRTTDIVFDPDDPDVFWEAGTHDTGGAHRTDDNGETFVRLGELVHADSIAVDFSDPDRETLLAHSHDSSQLHRSTDAGETWEEISAKLPDRDCNSPLIVDSDTFLLGCGVGQNSGGILRSTDGGEEWAYASDVPVSPMVRKTSEDLYYWITEDGGLLRSEDEGESWVLVTPAGTLSKFTAPVELPNGVIAAVSGTRFAGTLGGLSVVVSDDAGSTWAPATSQLPYSDVALAYSDSRNAFFTWRSECGNTVPRDAIMRFDYAFEAEQLP